MVVSAAPTATTGAASRGLLWRDLDRPLRCCSNIIGSRHYSADCGVIRCCQHGHVLFDACWSGQVLLNVVVNRPLLVTWLRVEGFQVLECVLQYAQKVLVVILLPFIALLGWV
jgi:hypothetical protein